MRTRRFGDEQIVGILKDHAAGERMGALCRRHGISEQTLYRWIHKYDGLEGNVTCLRRFGDNFAWLR